MNLTISREWQFQKDPSRQSLEETFFQIMQLKLNKPNKLKQTKFLY